MVEEERRWLRRSGSWIATIRGSKSDNGRMCSEASEDSRTTPPPSTLVGFDLREQRVHFGIYGNDVRDRIERLTRPVSESAGSEGGTYSG